MINNLEQIKVLIKQGLGCVANKMIVKDIQENFDLMNRKSVYPKTKTIVYIKSESFDVINILKTGVLLNCHKENSVPTFYSYEDIAPIQLWILAYVVIPKIIKKEMNHETIQSPDNDE